MAAEDRSSQTSTRSPNVLSVGDTVWCSLYGWDGERERMDGDAFQVRIEGFPDPHTVDVVAVELSDDPLVDNDFRVPWSQLRREVAR